MLFATPDINWTDIHEMLMGKGAATFMAPGETQPHTVREPLEKLVFTGLVTAGTDLSDISHTVFLLSGPAEVGYTAAHVSSMFSKVAVYLHDNDISDDPDTWLLLPRSNPTALAQKILRVMDHILERPPLRRAWDNNTPTVCTVTAEVTIRHIQGH